jgi:hypothetical protein
MELRKELSVVRNSYEGIAREINQVELRDAATFFRIGSYCAGNVKIRAVFTQQDKQYVKSLRNGPDTDEEHIRQVEKMIFERNRSMEHDLEVYGDAVESLHKKYQNSHEVVTAAFDQVVEQKKLQRQEHEIGSVKLVLEHVRDFTQRDARKWRRDIIEKIIYE